MTIKEVKNIKGMVAVSFDSDEKKKRYDEFCQNNQAPDLHCRLFINQLTNDERNKLIEWLENWQNFDACSWCVMQWELYHKRALDYVNKEM